MPSAQKRELRFINEADIKKLAASEIWLVSEFCKAALEMDDKDLEVVILRCGLAGGYQRTLIEVGDLFHVTRERIRVMESNAFKKHLVSLADLVAAKVEKACGKSKTLLTVTSPQLEKEFPGIADYVELFDYMLERGPSPRKLSNERRLLSTMREAEIDACKTATLKAVKTQMKAGETLYLKDVQSLCAKTLGKLIDKSLVDRDANIAFIADLALESFRFNDGGKLLGTNSSEIAYILNVLDRSPSALPVKEITRLSNELSAADAVANGRKPKAATQTYVRNLCIDNPLILNFGPSLFGLEKHAKFIAKNKDVLAQAMYDIARDSEHSIIHHEAAYETLTAKGLINPEIVPSYKDLAVISQSSENLVYLGYHKYTTKEKAANVSTADDRSISQDIEKFLEDFGGPMTSDEIITRLKAVRLIRSTFQVSTWGLVAPLGGKWGLIGRDMPYDEAGATKFSEFIAARFEKTGEVSYEDAKKEFLKIFKWKYDFNPHGAYLAAIPRLKKIPCRFAQGSIQKGYVKRREKI